MKKLAIVALAFGVMFLGVSSCKKAEEPAKDEPTVEEKVEKAADKAEDTGKKIEKAAKDVKDVLKK